MREPSGGADVERLASYVATATAAPSLHNSQPWRFRIRDGGVDVIADWARQLAVIDPSGRELLISVGAALFTLRLAIRHDGRRPSLTFPQDPDDPRLVARVTPERAEAVTGVVRALFDAVPERHTNRWPFAPSVVAAPDLEELACAAHREGASLTVAGAVARAAILGLTRTAEQRLRGDHGYRAELTQWTLPSPGRRDGVPTAAMGPWDALETTPVRDFGLALPQLTRPAERFEPFPTIVTLSTAGDTPADWLAAGQALQRVLLTATVLHLATTPFSQPVEIPAIRELLTTQGRHAQILIRLGIGPPTYATPRRPLCEVLMMEPVAAVGTPR
ncbi:Acg family FMN-binding oxidoreductase [Krasilnikovia cinnamomea]|nr:nitroreductase [Krasilnikovia cinnamomea]